MFPHDHIVDDHSCYEYRSSNELSVCYSLLSIVWLLEQVYDRSKDVRSTNSCQIQVFWHNLRVYIGQFSNRFHFLLLDILVVQARSWDFIQLLCLFVRQLTLSFNVLFPHVLPYHRITKRYSDFQSIVIFQLLNRKLWNQTWFYNCHQYFCFFHIVFE